MYQLFHQDKSKNLVDLAQKKQSQQKMSDLSLRGGGCCSTSINKVHITEMYIKPYQIPKNFDKQCQNHSQVIINKLPILEEDSDLFISFQWFINNEGNFWMISDQPNLVLKFYYQSLETFESFLNIMPKYLKSSGYLFMLLLKISNYFLQVIVKYQLFNDQRYLEEQKKEEFLIQIKELEKQINLESNKLWETGVQYEMCLIRTAITHLRTNSNKGEKILLNFITGLATSIAAFKLTDELKESLIEGAKMAFTMIYEQNIQNPIGVLKIFQLFKELKWRILNSLARNANVSLLFSDLQEYYLEYIKQSNNWIIHYNWIELISDLLVYRPQISKVDFTNEDWNKLQKSNIIKTFPFDSDLALLNQNLDSNLSFLMQKIKINKYYDLQTLLLKKSLESESSIALWHHYLNFEFHQRRQKNQQSTSLTQTLVSLLYHDNRYMDVLINNCEIALERFVQMQEEEVNLIKLLEQDNKNKNKVMMGDINRNFENQEKLMQTLIYQLIEYNSYFTFYVEKLQIFLQLLKINNLELKLSIKEQIDSIFNEFDILNNIMFQRFASSWIQNINTISQNQIRYLNNFNFKNVLGEQNNDQLDSTPLKIILEKLNNGNQIMTKVFQECVEFITSQNQQSFSKQLNINLKEFLQNSSKICKVSILSHMQSLVQSKSIDQKQKLMTQQNELCFDPSNWDFSNLNNIFQIQLQCYQFKNYLNAAMKLVQIQKIKFSALKKYFKQSELYICQSAFPNKDDDIQLIVVIETLKLQQSIIQSIEKSKIENDNQQNGNKINDIIDQLSEIKSQIMKINQSQDQNKKNIEIIFKMIKELRLFSLLNQSWDQLKIKILSSYENLLKSLSEKGQNINASQSNDNQRIEIKQMFEQSMAQKFKDLEFSITSLQQRCSTILMLISDYWNAKSELSEEEARIYFDTEFLDSLNLKEFQENYQIFIKSLDIIIQQNYIKLSESQQEVSIQCFNEFHQDYQRIIQQKVDFPNFQEYFLLLNSFQQNIETTQQGSSKGLLQNFFEDKGFRVRECLLYNLIKIQSETQDKNILKFIQDLIKYFWALEKNVNVRNLLNQKEMIECQQKIFNYDLRSFTDKLQLEMQQRIKEIEMLEQKARMEGFKANEFENLLNQKYEEFDQFFSNISEMSDKLGLQFLFLKEIAKDLKILKNKIDKIQETVDMIGDDIRKLRGKTYKELLEIRKNKILEQRNFRELDTVYVELRTKEYDSKTGQIVKTEKGQLISRLFKSEKSDFEGEINEFLWNKKQSSKDVFLLKGQAGSGKTRAAKMVEEFLWEHFDDSNCEIVKWVPIFVSLPLLKDPKYNLLAEALESDDYQFDKFQITELLEDIKNNNLKIILILDSYDEMKSENTEANLYSTNKFRQLFNISSSGDKLKIIITVRTEMLKFTNYQILFFGSDQSALKEVELLPFSNEQGQEYIKQYCELSLKRKIRNTYEFVKQISDQKFNLLEFLLIWKNIKSILSEQEQKQSNQKIIDLNQSSQVISNQQQQDFQTFEEKFNNKKILNTLFNFFQIQQEDTISSLSLCQDSTILDEQNISRLMKAVRNNQILQGISNQQLIALQKDISSLWNEKQFTQAIKNIHIEHLLQTPFMMEIIMQVLPHIVDKYSDYEIVKKEFCKSFKQLQLNNQDKLNLDQYQQNNEEPANQNQQKQKNVFNQLQNQLQQILDKMEMEKFFSSFKISETLSVQNGILKLGKQEYNFGAEAEMVLKALRMRSITVYDFYESFVQFYSETQLLKWRDLGKVYNYESFLIDFIDFQESLALDMTLRQLTQITHKTQGKLKLRKVQNYQDQQENWEDQYFNIHNQEDQNYYKLLKSCILISTNGNTHQFNHKSIQEYFVSKYIVNIIDKFELDLQNDDILIRKNKNFIETSFFNNKLFNISQNQYLGSLKLMKEKLLQNIELEDKMLQIIRFSIDTKFSRAASNCIFILSYLKSFIINQDLSSINIQETIISGVSLHDCNLSESKFDNVTIDSSNLSLSNLKDIKWKNIIYNETKMFMDSILGKVNLIVINRKQDMLLIQHSDKNISFWDLQGSKVLKTIENLHEINIIALSLASQREILASADPTTIKVWDYSNLEKIIQIGLIRIISIQKISFTQNDEVLVLVTQKQIVQMDVQQVLKNYTPSQYHQFEKYSISASIFSKDGQYLFIGTHSHQFSVLDSKECKQIFSYEKYEAIIQYITISKDSSMLATGSEKNIFGVWNFQNQKLILVRNFYIYISQLKMCFLSQNSKLLMINRSFLYQVNYNKFQTSITMQELKIEELNVVRIFNISSIASGDLFGFVIESENEINSLLQFGAKNFDANVIQKPKTFELKYKVKYFVFSKKNYLALIFRSFVEIWDYTYTNKITQIKIKDQLEEQVIAIFSSDELQLTIKYEYDFEVYSFIDQTNILFTSNKNSVQANTILFEFNEVEYISSIKYSNNNNYIAICLENHVYLFMTEKFTFVKKINQKKLKKVKFSNDDSLLFLMGYDNLIIYQIQEDKFTVSKYPNDQIIIDIFQFENDNNTLIQFFDQVVAICQISLFDQTVRLKLKYQQNFEFQFFEYCYLENQQAFILINRLIDKLVYYQYKQTENYQLDILDSHLNNTNDICISSSENLIAQVGQNESILWEISNEIYQQIAQLPGGNYVVFFKNDNYLAINQNLESIQIISLKSKSLKPEIIQNIQYQLVLEYDFYELNLLNVNDELFLSYQLNQYSKSQSGHPIQQMNGIAYFDQTTEKFRLKGLADYNQQEQQFQNSYSTIQVNPKNYQLFKIHPKSILVENKINQNILKKIIFQNIIDFVYEMNMYYIVANSKEIIFLNSAGNIINQFNYNQSQIKNIQFIYSTRQLIIGEIEGNITIFNCEKISLDNENKNDNIPPVYHQFTSDKKLNTMQFSNQQQIIISAHDNYLYFWDLRSKQKILSFSAHQQKITTIMIFKDGKYFLTGSEDKTFKIWDLEAIQQVQDDEAHNDSLEKIKYESFNEVITLGLDNTLCIWNAKQKQFVKKINNIKNFVHFQDQFVVCDNSDKIYYFKNQKSNKNNLLYLELLGSNFIKVLNWEDFIGFEDKLFHYFITNKLSYKYFLNPQIFNIIQSNQPRGEAKASTLNLENFSIFLRYQNTYPYSKGEKKFQFEIYELNQEQKSLKFRSSFSITLENYQIKKIFFLMEKIFFISNFDNFLFVQELQNLQQSKFQKLSGHQNIIQDMIYSKPYIITQDSGGKMIFWLIVNYQKQILIMEKILEDLNKEKSELITIGISQQKQYLATQHINGFIYVWNIQDFEKLKLESELTLVTNLENNQYKAQQIEFSPNGNILACLYQDFIWFYNLSNKNLSKQIMRSSYQLFSFFCFHPKLPEIICEKNQLFSFNFNYTFDHQELQIFHELRNIKFSNDQNLLASSISTRYTIDNKYLKIYDIQGAKILNNIELKQNKYADCQMNFSLFNQFFSSLFTNQKKLIILKSDNTSIYLEQENIVSAEFTNDEKAIFVATTRQDLQIISLESKQIIQTVTNFQYSIKAICLSPNNSLFFLGLNDGTLLLYAFSKDAVKNPQQYLQNQQDYSIKPFCYKSFSRYSQLLANGCILNEKSVIETQNKQSLIQTFLLKEAILTEEQNDAKKQQGIKNQKQAIQSQINGQKK